MTQDKKKAKTSVVLPGGIKGLVRELQRDSSEGASRQESGATLQETGATTQEKTVEARENPSVAQPEAAEAQEKAEDRQQTATAAGHNGKTNAPESGVGERAKRRPEIPQETGDQVNESFVWMAGPAPEDLQEAARQADREREAYRGETDREHEADREREGYRGEAYRDHEAEGEGPAWRQTEAQRRQTESQIRQGGAQRRQAKGTLQSQDDAPAATSGRGRRPKQHTMKQYHVIKDDTRDSWELFLDLAKQYKDGGGRLATIYIDESLKNVLDRMKYAGPEHLPTAAILSSIVARFIYDHEDDIKQALFNQPII